jgi:hypothetical protein
MAARLVDIYSSLFFHRAAAAFLATLLRWAAVIVSKRRLPPILPPLRPIADMSMDTWAFVGGSVSSFSRVETLTKWWASSFTSLGRLGCLISFGMQAECHTKAGFARARFFKVAHYLAPANGQFEVRALAGYGVNQELARGAAGFVVNFTPKPVGDGLFE